MRGRGKGGRVGRRSEGKRRRRRKEGDDNVGSGRLRVRRIIEKKEEGKKRGKKGRGKKREEGKKVKHCKGERMTAREVSERKTL